MTNVDIKHACTFTGHRLETLDAVKKGLEVKQSYEVK